MKTIVDLTQFDFSSRIFNQISDCPDTGFVRVLVFYGENYQEKIKQWFINAEIVFINPSNNKIVYTKVAKSKNQDWVISNNYRITIFDANGKPTPNPDFKTEKDVNTLDADGKPILDAEGNNVTHKEPMEISNNNLPYLIQGAFDRLSEFKVGTSFSLPIRQLWDMSVASDDANGYFDEKENHKTLVEIQTELYNQINQ